MAVDLFLFIEIKIQKINLPVFFLVLNQTLRQIFFQKSLKKFLSLIFENFESRIKRLS